ncbi:MAG: glycosyltransferase [Bacteroides sp.]|nr:glycosyltransferase [Bacteroides sp.]
MDFIITSLQSWDTSIGSTIKNTAVEISKKHRVFYVSTPPSLTQWIRNRQKKNDEEIHKGLYIIWCTFPALPVNQMPFKWLFNAVNYLNNYLIAKTIKKAIRKYDIQSYIHLIDNDVYRSRYLKQLLHPNLSIYYRRDYVIGVKYWRKYGPTCEYELVRQSDIVITNSTFFTKELSAYNTNIYTTNTGVNLELYDASISHAEPTDLQSIPSPRIGYTGAVIERRLDAELLYRVASQLSQYQFVFVGPEDEFFQNHRLHTLKNVHFLGQKAVSQLPEYIQYFDVCLNPQILNPITEGNYPLKIDEYLAMGKPVVATSTHTMRDVFAAHTHLATDADSYVQAIEDALKETKNEDLRKARIAFAHTHSWGHSVEKIYAAIEEYKKKLSLQK